MKTHRIAALTCAAALSGSAAFAADPTPAELPSYCQKAAALKAKSDQQSCIAAIAVPQSSPLYAGKKKECVDRSTAKEGRYQGDCQKQLGRSISNNIGLWPVR